MADGPKSQGEKSGPITSNGTNRNFLFVKYFLLHGRHWKRGSTACLVSR